MIIREAEISDLFDVYQWRNDLYTCEMSADRNKVIFSDHKFWFENSLNNPLRKIYIGIFFNKKIGVCRFDKDTITNTCEVSINMNPEMRGKNLSFLLLFESILTYRKFCQIKLSAKIRKINKASCVIFMRCGFIVVANDDKFFYLIKSD